MKRTLSLMAAACMATALTAQTDRTTFKTPTAMRPVGSACGMQPQSLQPSLTATPSASLTATTGMTSAADRHRQADGPKAKHTGEEVSDSTVWYPTPYSTYYNYGPLHAGLNVSLDLSAFATFGKHAKGGGFGQRLTAAWLQPLGRNGWVAAGGYVNHLTWNGNHYTSGGLTAEVGYRFNDHWAAYVYGQKSLVNQGAAYGGYPLCGRGLGAWGYSPYMMGCELGDRLGAAVRWTPNPTFSVEISVEKGWAPKGTGNYWGQHNYPTPPTD